MMDQLSSNISTRKLQNLSDLDLLSLESEEQQTKILGKLTPQELLDLRWSWSFQARKDQLEPPGNWNTWLINAGRGWGKTRVGAETVRSWATSGRYGRIALVAETAADARDVLVEGESGLLSVHPPQDCPHYEPSKRRLTWPNGAIATLYNATEPDQLRGPQHDAAWCDELAKWLYVRETWDMLQFTMRLGANPRKVITTTPRPIAVVKEILKASGTVLTHGHTLDNESNLAAPFIKQIIDRYSGTRLGRQELAAEILDDNPNALWKRDQIDALRIARDKMPQLRRIVVAIDPSGTAGAEVTEEASDVGIVVAGIANDGQGYVLADNTVNMAPDGWGRRAVEAYHFHNADRIVAERNFGGAMVHHVIKTCDPSVSYKEVIASRGKWVRAEPVSALYEQGRVHHVGSFTSLEDEMCEFGPDGKVDGKSPNRLDALVWAITELMLDAPVPAAYGRYSAHARR